VDIFDTDGHLLTPNHFAANAPGGPLENPWGIVQAPADFGAFSNDILIGNVEGDGNINAFDPATGAFLGQLRHPNGTPIAIPGLWDLTFGGDSPANGLTKQLYFDAGPNVPNPAGNGLFGRIIAAEQGDGRASTGDSAAGMIMLRLQDHGSAVSGVASAPSAVPPVASLQDRPLLRSQTARATALPLVSAPATSDQPRSRSGHSPSGADAIDGVFAWLADAQDAVLVKF
jgi:hypothetical protein